jgi:quercetin dioxygenase-like cupin family protein
MRKLITGVDADGRSCIVETISLEPQGSPAGPARLDTIAATTPVPPPRPVGAAPTVDLGLEPGATHWLIVEYAPGATGTMHHTDSIDYDIVLEGSVELELDDGSHSLEVGDLVVVNGVDHSWTAGPAGCTLSVVNLGTTPPA